MKTESDGFKIFEHRDRFDDCIQEMYNNEILLRDQIRELRKEIEELRRQIYDGR